MTSRHLRLPLATSANLLFKPTAGKTANIPLTGLGTSGVPALAAVACCTMAATYRYRIDLSDSPDTIHVAIYTPTNQVFHELGAAGAELPIGGGNIIVK